MAREMTFWERQPVSTENGEYEGSGVPELSPGTVSRPVKGSGGDQQQEPGLQGCHLGAHRRPLASVGDGVTWAGVG